VYDTWGSTRSSTGGKIGVVDKVTTGDVKVFQKIIDLNCPDDTQ